ncbi:MAG: ATP-binding protein [Bacteroidota bacterium]|nr:ATP-binding protein [Bacteroidota bacterium]
MIKRDKYLKRIIPFIDKPLIKVITGIRRCGKSTLLKQISNEILDNGVSEHQIININKELIKFDFIKDYLDLHSFVSRKAKNNKLKYYLFIDEVQEIQTWEKAINSFLAEEKYDIYISGSNADLLSSDLATLISGRHIEFPVYTFTYDEFCRIYANRAEVDSNTDVFSEFIKYGGFPGLHHIEWEEDILRQYLESIYSTIVLKDVIKRNNIKSVYMLRNILNFIASNCGNISSAKKISDFTKSQGQNITTDTVLNYIEYTMNALLVHKTKRFDIIGKRLLETYEKYYLADTGLSFTMIGNSPNMISGKLENIVNLELLSRGYKVNIGKIRNKEIDFIALKNKEKIYIQVCSTLLGEDTYKREYGAFSGVNDHYPKYVVSLDSGNFSKNEDGIIWMNIKDFLLKQNLT